MDQDSTERSKTYENFLLYFLAMGQGDCMLVRCPNREVLMIDCGSKAYFSQVTLFSFQRLVRAQQLAGGNDKKIDVLILTHSDKDHYNQLLNMVGKYRWPDLVTKDKKTVSGPEFSALQVEEIYISSLPHSLSTAPMYHYSENDVSNEIYKDSLKTSQIHEVTINSSSNEYKTWLKSDGFTKVATTTQISNKALSVRSGTTKEGKKWSVSIIAGNVPKDKTLTGNVKDTATEDNAVSLVTLLQFDSSKALICGDATHSTEAFLLTQHKDLIKNIDLLQAPHHGSLSSSGAGFVEQVSPKVVVVSVGYMENSHNLPREKVYRRWTAKLADKKTKEHELDNWFRNNTRQAGIKTSWEKNKMPVGNNKDKSFFWINDTTKILKNSIWGYTKKGFLLRRESTEKSIWQTSTLGLTDHPWLEFTLPS
jgi:beta-lactamase superfamily II metal-dependent hydrolase